MGVRVPGRGLAEAKALGPRGSLRKMRTSSVAKERGRREAKESSGKAEGVAQHAGRIDGSGIWGLS